MNNNIDQNNPYPIYLGVGLVAASLSYCLFNRMVTYCCKKEKTQTKGSTGQPDSLLSSRELQNTSTVHLQPKTTLQSQLKDLVSQFEGDNYQNAKENIKIKINNKTINNSETAIFLASLLKEQLDRIGPVNQNTSVSSSDHIIHDYILTHLLKDLIQLNQIEDNQFLSELGIYLKKIFPNVHDSIKPSILQTLQSIVKHKLNDDALTEIKNLCVDILENQRQEFQWRKSSTRDILTTISGNNKTFYEALPKNARDQIEKLCSSKKVR